MRYSVLLLVFIVFGCQPKHDIPVSIELNKRWEFKKVTDTVWYAATVPGNVFSDLFENKLIKDPFIGENESEVQWVSVADWEYKTSFSVEKEVLKKKHLALNFEGLDTYASVFLNDSLILKTKNAFRSFDTNVKTLLKAENELRILFEKTSKYEKIEKEKLAYDLPEGGRIFTRKAQFQYGWDWGPKLNSSGIWRPVNLIAWNDYKIEDIYLKQNETNESESNLSIVLNPKGSFPNTLNFEVYVNGLLLSDIENVSDTPTEFAVLPITIKKPKLWWPHNLGDPYLYDVKVIAMDGGKIVDSISTKYGIRDIELVTEKDSLGEGFYFKVNNVPVYAKGANYIPQNSMQNKVTAAHYEKLLNDVVEANMNMLRVWGGGIYENDVFYNLCDEKGILVWQDFMFACAMYPGDEEFTNNVAQEAVENVKRLRNHPSIALWCGNNENSEGWHRWGWQAGRSADEKDEIWNNYLKVFDSILPNTVSQYTTTDYWESSPKYGRGNPKYKTEGDAHDWWIWHDAYPFEHLTKNVPRFMSEFGFQSFPSYEVIRYINQNDSISLSSLGFKNHQKHIRGFQLIDQYMQLDFPVPTAPEDYVYMSQLLQSYGIAKGVEAQRRSKPYNMGTLYWQLNDCWPAVSWSSIDFMGNWKALHYKVKRSFENVLVSNSIAENNIETFLINDGLQSEEGFLELEIRTFHNETVWSAETQIVVAPLSAERKYRYDLREIKFKKEDAYLITRFNGRVKVDFFVAPKQLKLKSGAIQKQIKKTSHGFEIAMQSETFQKDVFLYTDKKGHFSDNFFNMLPHKTYTIYFKTTSETLGNLKLKSFNTFVR